MIDTFAASKAGVGYSFTINAAQNPLIDIYTGLTSPNPTAAAPWKITAPPWLVSLYTTTPLFIRQFKSADYASITSASSYGPTVGVYLPAGMIYPILIEGPEDGLLGANGNGGSGTLYVAITNIIQVYNATDAGSLIGALYKDLN